MMSWTTIRLALRSLAANKLRSILAMLGIIIAVWSVISALALGSGAQATVVGRLSSLGTNLLIVRPAQRGSGGVVDLPTVSERLTGEGFLAEQAPPRLLEGEPAGALGNEHLLDAWVGGEPARDGWALVAGEVVGDEVQVAIGVGRIDRIEQLEVPRSVP